MLVAVVAVMPLVGPLTPFAILCAMFVAVTMKLFVAACAAPLVSEIAIATLVTVLNDTPPPTDVATFVMLTNMFVEVKVPYTVRFVPDPPLLLMAFVALPPTEGALLHVTPEVVAVKI